MARKKASVYVTALDVERALRERYAEPAWAFLAQVRNGTGWQRAKARTADAIAFSLWPSRGLELHGFEIKVDRGDVRRELADPEKAEDFFRFCDRWWLAVSDEELVQPGELPPTWGLLVLQGKQMRCKVEAPLLQDAKALDRVQLAAIFRSVHEANTPTDDVEARIKSEVEEAVKHRRDNLEHLVKELQERIDEFEKASGVKLANRWDAGRVGEAVELVLAQGHEAPRARLERLRREAKEMLAMLDALAAASGDLGSARGVGT